MQLFVYYNIIPMSILFLIQGAYKLHPATQTHPVLPVLITNTVLQQGVPEILTITSSGFTYAD
jgi:hypothetical protein